MNQDKLLLSLNLPSSSHISSIASANNSTDCSAKSNQAGALEREIPISWEFLNDTRSPNKSPDILCHVTVGSHIDPFKHSTLNQSPNPLCIPPFMGGTKVFATGCSAITCGTATASIIANSETAPITSGERTIHLPLFTACKLYDDTKLFEKPKPLLFTDGIQGKAKVMPKATAESATISSNPQNSSCSKCKTLKTSKWYNFKNDELFCNLCWHFGNVKNGELDKKIPTSNGVLIGVESVQESLPVIFSSTSLKKFKSDSSTENSGNFYRDVLDTPSSTLHDPDFASFPTCPFDRFLPSAKVVPHQPNFPSCSKCGQIFTNKCHKSSKNELICE